MTYAVELEERPKGKGGTTLVVITDRPHSRTWLGLATRPVVPAEVAAAIRQARRQGWDPAADGAYRELRWPAAETATDAASTGDER
ncbi:hypothetical protein [Streptomyces millisiae]|uniref:Uncharacterized protein n=1 Tax=Streptomyces millisiae TaxID=3075542 RepID=A0ABU2LWA5_9ACTN|nr:hypothetical protein [Streptomyces sp. DSM 44918]MDT0321863.1 hypothetical protein [Streptomyces sp. DSM 44918]